MTKFKDKNGETANIEMLTANGEAWEKDFFNVEALEHEEDSETGEPVYLVEDIWHMMDQISGYFHDMRDFDTEDNAGDPMFEETATFTTGGWKHFIMYPGYWSEPMEAPITRTWLVYGQEGHRQRVSFGESFKWDFSEGKNTRIIEVRNADRTGTNDYSEVVITRNTWVQCWEEMQGQLTDGIFENSAVGRVEEV